MKALNSVEEVKGLIAEGKTLLLAGDESVMKLLPKGNWIGGTIPYFMGDEGGVVSKDKILVEIMPDENKLESIIAYAPDDLPNIPKGYAENGISFIIVPAYSEVHTLFAKDIMSYEGLFNSPLVGWIAGCHLDDFETQKPKVYNGLTGEVFDDRCIVMHNSLPDEIYAKVDTINIFEDDEENGDVIQFSNESAVINECTVNGKPVVFADYLADNNINTQLPIIGDFMGAKLNISIQSINEETKDISTYAPVFKNIDYRFAKPLNNYVDAFTEKLDTIAGIKPVFSCNCILNFLYGELEGKSTGKITGPITFGEIAYMLLNQTMVYVTYEKK